MSIAEIATAVANGDHINQVAREKLPASGYKFVTLYRVDGTHLYVVAGWRLLLVIILLCDHPKDGANRDLCLQCWKIEQIEKKQAAHAGDEQPTAPDRVHLDLQFCHLVQFCQPSIKTGLRFTVDRPISDIGQPKFVVYFCGQFLDRNQFVPAAMR